MTMPRLSVYCYFLDIVGKNVNSKSTLAVVRNSNLLFNRRVSSSGEKTNYVSTCRCAMYWSFENPKNRCFKSLKLQNKYDFELY